MELPTLNLPPISPRFRRGADGRTAIFDILRRRYVALTPEEWVRQHFVHFLSTQKGYPMGLLANEISLMLNGVRRRCDTVLYQAEGLRPRMIVEYKAPDIPITQAVFTQIAAYNSQLRADYLVVSNGRAHYCLALSYSKQTSRFLPDIPAYHELQ